MSENNDVSIDYKRLSDQAVSSIMMALQKGVAERCDITDILRDMAFVEDDGELIVNNPPQFEMKDMGEEQDGPEVIVDPDEG